MTDHKEAAITGSDVSIPSPARIYDYFLGGKDNYEVDRQIAEQVLSFAPDTRTLARLNRGFLVRSVDFAARAGIRQFIDLGTGIPTSPNTHEVARLSEPEASVVYVDNDPLVKVHNDARLKDNRIVTLQADAREPRTILDNPRVRALIDFEQPIALMLVSLLHMVADEDDPRGIINTFREKMVPGSQLIISHMTDAGEPGALETFKAAMAGHSADPTFRSRDAIRALFEGFELVEPGIVQVQDWRPDGASLETALVIDCGVGILR